MAVKCDVCGKKTQHGDQHIHRHSAWRYRAPRTKRTWKPNLRKVKVRVGNRVITLKMCMGCYSKYTVEGIDFLKRKGVKEVLRALGQ